MHRDAFANAGAHGGFATGNLQRAGAHVVAPSPGGKQIVLGVGGAGDVVNVVALSLGGKMAQLHVFDHALT